MCYVMRLDFCREKLYINNNKVVYIRNTDKEVGDVPRRCETKVAVRVFVGIRSRPTS